MSSFLVGLVVAVPIITVLIVAHELGHYLVARRFGVRIFEFGIGFPPRLFGIWSGRTLIRIDAGTSFPNSESLETLKGRLVKVRTEGRRAVEITLAKRYSVSTGANNVSFGKVKAVEKGHILLAEMVWSFNLVPIGGFVRMEGEENSSSPRSLAYQSPPKRLAVIGAGVVINLLLPFVLLPIAMLFPQQVADIVVEDVFNGSPAHFAGIMHGDQVLTINGSEVSSFAQVRAAANLSGDEAQEWEVKRLPSGEMLTVNAIPRKDPPVWQVVQTVQAPSSEISLDEARGYYNEVGVNNVLIVVEQSSDSLYEISLEDTKELRYGEAVEVGDRLSVVNEASQVGEISLSEARLLNRSLGVVTTIEEGPIGVIFGIQEGSVRYERVYDHVPGAIWNGFKAASNIITLSATEISRFVSNGREDVSDGASVVGPIGIAQITSEVAGTSMPFVSKLFFFMFMAAALSFSLAVVNVLPIPALDGGRMFFVALEWVRGGRKVSPKVESAIHFLGFAVLLGLILLVSVNDITRLIRGETIF